MTIRMIDSGEIAEVEDCWGERLVEHGRAEPANPKPAAEAAVTGKTPEAAEAEEEAKADAAKKAGKKR